MSNFELIEVPFDSDDFSPSLEDEFLLARIGNELQNVTDIEQLRTGAQKLLQLAVMRQSVIRSLIKRIAKLEDNVIRTQHAD